MSKEKILRDHEISVVYSERDWQILNSKRDRAINLLEMFAKEGLNPYIYGSIARGNVHQDSDIDIVFTDQIPSYQIEFILGKNGFKNYFREILMATPLDSLKLYIYLSELECITVPLSKLEKKTVEFYDFGGKINLSQLKSEIRVPGIDKRLVLIRPNIKGHEEVSIIGNESTVAKEVGISLNIINERIKVLLRREKYGRTGVFLKRSIEMGESTEDVLKKLANKKSIVRKKLYKR
ncbi:MAG: DNA polymerase subunit beta [Promethearchaeota archaeon]|nr:MAG: DNA polymerase subunit beta [Candidatus Lokiarchaeota archaeon]